MKQEVSKTPLISIIIPVYNVFHYIDKCLESVVAQTYKNIEILLINDGSTDGSDKKCLDWQKKDSRVIFISKKNEHTGPTRNMGIQISHGDILSFIDPDDYVDITFIEKMYYALINNHTDFVCCDFYLLQEKNQEFYEKKLIRERFCGIKFFENDIETLYMSSQLWNKMYYKRIFIDNNLWMSNRIGQDIEISFKLMINAKSVFFLHEPLYYYLNARKGAATTGVAQLYDMIAIRKNIVDYYKKKNLFKKYYNSLKTTAFRSLSIKMQKAKKLLNHNSNELFQNNCINFLQKYFPDWNIHKNFIVWGSYNLRQILYFTNEVMSENMERYMYSSLISAMSNNSVNFSYNLKLNNIFQQKMIQQDLNRNFYFSENCNADYIIIDFLEERLNVLVNNELEITDNREILQEQENFFVEQGFCHTIPSTSKKFIELWKEKCKVFISLLQKKFLPNQVFLIENYLMEYYGAYQKEEKFQEIKEIQNINNMLKEFYIFFEKEYPKINVIKIDKPEVQFVDSFHDYGCYPFHYNIFYYNYVANKIKNCFDGKNI